MLMFCVKFYQNLCNYRSKEVEAFGLIGEFICKIIDIRFHFNYTLLCINVIIQ